MTTPAEPISETVRPVQRQTSWLALGAGGLTLVLWASAFVAIRQLRHDVSPGALSLGRLTVAAVVLGVLVRRRPRRWPARSDRWLLLLCGVAWFGIYNLALNAAERRIDAGTAALVVQVGPLVVGLLATLLLGERMTPGLLVGMIVGFGGVVVISRGTSSGHGDLLGVGLAVVAALTYAVGVLAQKPLLTRGLPALEVTFLSCVIGAIVCLPWTGDLIDVARDGKFADLGWLVYLGLFPTAIGFTCWAYALRHSRVSTLSLTTFLVPFIATAIAWPTLGEVPPAIAFVGGVLCIGGVLITRIPSRRP